jgi:hypothetical protein
MPHVAGVSLPPLSTVSSQEIAFPKRSADSVIVLYSLKTEIKARIVLSARSPSTSRREGR